MERLSKSLRRLEKQPRSLRTPELAKTVNAVAWRFPDEQKIAPLVAPWNSYVQYTTKNEEEPPQAWAEMMDEIDPKEAWSISRLLETFVSPFFNFETVGDIRDFCAREGHYFRVSRRSMDFGAVAFRRKYQRSPKA